MILVVDNLDEFLEHFGVKGMQWGVRKQYESVKEGGSNLREKVKAHNLQVNTDRHNTIKARIAKGDIRISEVNAGIADKGKGFFEKNALRNERKILLENRARDVKKTKGEPSTGLTSTQKKILIGAGVTAAIIASHYAFKYMDHESIGAALRNRNSQAQYGDIFKHNDAFANKNLSPEDVLKNVVKGINPNYNTQGGTMNCRRATFAYELRRRGFDVQATTSPIGYGQNETGFVNAMIKGDRNLMSAPSMSAFAGNSNAVEGIRTRALKGDTRVYDAFTETIKFKPNNVTGQASSTSVGNLISSLKKQPNGARGEAVFDVGPFAHSMQWEIFNGEPHIFDSQKAARYPGTKEGFSKLFDKWGSPESVSLTRLDNVDLDTKFLSRWAKNTEPARASVAAADAAARRSAGRAAEEATSTRTRTQQDEAAARFMDTMAARRSPTTNTAGIDDSLDSLLSNILR